MKIYIASSWRNLYYFEVKASLESVGHKISDWRKPETAFRWSQLSNLPAKDWDMRYYRSMLYERRASEGFDTDWNLMRKSDCCVLLLPCGRSAHLEAGYFVGAGKPLYIYIPEPIEPELMYRFASVICLTPVELLQAVGQA